MCSGGDSGCGKVQNLGQIPVITADHPIHIAEVIPPWKKPYELSSEVIVADGSGWAAQPSYTI